MLKEFSITSYQLLDQASEFILDPTAPFVLKRWKNYSPSDKPYWAISDTCNYASFLSMDGEWEQKKSEESFHKRILWSEPLAAAAFYYGWRSKFYWVYVKGASDRQWYWQIYTKEFNKAKEMYKNMQSNRPSLHWMLIAPDRTIIREDPGEKKQEWIDYPLKIDASAYLKSLKPD